MRRRLAPLLAAASVLAAAPRLHAQSTPPAVVYVRVVDSTNAPMAGVTLVVLHVGDQASFTGTTNAAGRFGFQFVPDSGAYHIVARKLGYVGTTRLLPAVPGDTTSVTLSLARLPPTLDTVHVDARALSDAYRIDASMISNVKQYVANAYDAMRDINPGMLGDGERDCRPAMNVWVNGVRVKFSPTPTYDLPVSQSYVTREELFGIPGASRQAVSYYSPHARVDNILYWVRPQDVADISYHNCWDNSVPDRGMRNAIFITLKPGIAFDEKHGSYPADSLPDRR